MSSEKRGLETLALHGGTYRADPDCAVSPTPTRISCPAAWRSVRHWRAPWSTIRAFCCWTNCSPSSIH